VLALTQEMQLFDNLLTSLKQGEHSAKAIMAQAKKLGIGERAVKRYQSDLKKGEGADIPRRPTYLRSISIFISVHN